MKDYVFIADDAEIEPADFEDMRRVAVDLGFEPPFNYSRIEDRRDALLLKAHSLADDGNHVYLITDALFPFAPIPKLGGARLGEDFLKVGGSDPRVVIRSSQPLLSDELKHDPRVLATKRTDSIPDLFIFLKTGKIPAVKKCLDFLRHIDAINHLVSKSESDSAESVAMVIETLCQGFGSVVPEPFDGSTLGLFDSSVTGVLGQGLYCDNWRHIVKSFHPYEALKSAASPEFSPSKMPGSFLVLWFVCLARSRPFAALAGLQKSENCFAPREQEWIRRRRRAVVERIHVQYSERTDLEKWGKLLTGAREEFNSIHKLLKTRDEVGG